MKRFTIMIWVIILAVLLLNPLKGLQAQQNPQDIFSEIRKEHSLIQASHKNHLPSARSSSIEPKFLGNQDIDVQHYRLQITLDPAAPLISGTVTIQGKATQAVNQIKVDLLNNLAVDELQINGQPGKFQRMKDHVAINLSSTLAKNDQFEIKLKYHGKPSTDNQLGGGMLISQHGTEGTLVMASLSEPFASPSWWPCVDDPTDKATIELEVTVPKGFQAASNGMLSRVEAGDKTSTYFWREDYPLSTYLVSVATTNYVTFEDVYTAQDGTKLPLVYYVYPEHLNIAQQKFGITRTAMEIFVPLYGEYPFINEKYGMAEFPWGGAMEHQTMTSMSDAVVASKTYTGRGIIAHELAHHWWGDLVTLGSWHDIWLNEGFATYSETLFFEKLLNIPAGQIMSESFDDGRAFGYLRGSVYAENAEDPFDDFAAIYDKGGWVLHMLRHQLGDEEFFKTLKEYRDQFAFKNAVTKDFQTVAEKHYGKSLDWFFQQWVFTPLRPIYKVSTSISAEANNKFNATVKIKQKQKVNIPGRDGDMAGVYIMPIDLTFHYEDGSKEVRTITNDARQQSFTFSLSKKPVRIGFDEENWVLKELKTN